MIDYFKIYEDACNEYWANVELGTGDAETAERAGIAAVVVAAQASVPEERPTAWRQDESLSTLRQVAWIDNQARYVAMVKGGKEFVLHLPTLPDMNVERS
jgi:hypothetical protein